MVGHERPVDSERFFCLVPSRRERQRYGLVLLVGANRSLDAVLPRRPVGRVVAAAVGAQFELPLEGRTL